MKQGSKVILVGLGVFVAMFLVGISLTGNSIFDWFEDVFSGDEEPPIDGGVSPLDEPSGGTSSPPQATNSDESEDIISCVDVEGSNSPGENESGNIPPYESAGPGDCTLYSQAVANYILHPEIPLQEWYDFIANCAQIMGYYPLTPLGRAYPEDVLKCKELKAKLSGVPEYFVQVDNSLTCPPYRGGGHYLLSFHLRGTKIGHSVYCQLKECPGPDRFLRKFECYDKFTDGRSARYSLWIDTFHKEVSFVKPQPGAEGFTVLKGYTLDGAFEIVPGAKSDG